MFTPITAYTGGGVVTHSPNVKGKSLASSLKIDDEFANNFIHSDHKKKMEILRTLNPSQKEKLFEQLKSFVSGAGDEQSKTKSERALIVVGGNIIAGKNPKNYKDAIIDTLLFIHDKVKSGGFWNLEKRDADMWGAGEVLADGRYNGCAEAAKTFETLLREALNQKELRGVEISPIYSFREDLALKGEYYLKKDVPGHDLIEVSQNGEAFLIDPALGSDRYETKRKPTFDELKKITAIRPLPVNGQYQMDQDGKVYNYRLFGKGLRFNKQENPNNRWDTSTSGGAARQAMKLFHESSPRK